MTIMLTERAAQEVLKAKESGNLEATTFLRVGVRGGGCSGFDYAMNFDTNYDEKQDTKLEIHGVQVVVDKKSSLYLDGTTIDYYESLEKKGFKFENPNAKSTCGCGSSFSV